MTRRHPGNFWTLSLLAALPSACGGEGESLPASSGRWTLALELRQQDPFPRQYTGIDGETYRVPRPPQRIASGTLFSDEVLLAICPKERIAALHEVSTKPLFSPVAAQSRDFPHHLTPDPESVLAVRPDLVFLSEFSDRRLQQLVSSSRRLVVRLHRFTSIAGVQGNIRALGYVVGLDRAAEGLVVEMQSRLDAVAENADRRRAWRLLSWSDGFVAGRGTIFDDVLRHVGATNLAALVGVEGAGPLGPERVLAIKPDALVIGVMEGREEEARERLRQVPALRKLPAVRRNRIVFVPNGLLMSTTHHLATCAERIAAVLDKWGEP